MQGEKLRAVCMTLALLMGTAFSSAAVADARCHITRDKHHRIARSQTELRTFKRHNPCPSTGRRSGSYPGYVIDHIDPLCNCGADVSENMQWQTVSDAKIKDRWERKICSRTSRKLDTSLRKN